MDPRIEIAHVLDVVKQIAPHVGCLPYDKNNLNRATHLLTNTAKMPVALKGFPSVEELLRANVTELKFSSKNASVLLLEIQSSLAKMNLTMGLFYRTGTKKVLSELCEDDEDESPSSVISTEQLHTLCRVVSAVNKSTMPIGVVLYDENKLDAKIADYFSKASVKRKLVAAGDLTVREFVQLSHVEMREFFLINKTLSFVNMRFLMKSLAQEHLFWQMPLDN